MAPTSTYVFNFHPIGSFAFQISFFIPSYRPFTRNITVPKPRRTNTNGAPSGPPRRYLNFIPRRSLCKQDRLLRHCCLHSRWRDRPLGHRPKIDSCPLFSSLPVRPRPWPLHEARSCLFIYSLIPISPSPHVAYTARTASPPASTASTAPHSASAVYCRFFAASLILALVFFLFSPFPLFPFPAPAKHHSLLLVLPRPRFPSDTRSFLTALSARSCYHWQSVTCCPAVGRLLLCVYVQDCSARRPTGAYLPPTQLVGAFCQHIQQCHYQIRQPPRSAQNVYPDSILEEVALGFRIRPLVNKQKNLHTTQRAQQP